MFVFIPRSTLVPGNKAIGPTGPAPSAVFVLRALQLSVPRVRPAALRALRGSPIRMIEERNVLYVTRPVSSFLFLITGSGDASTIYYTDMAIGVTMTLY